MQLTSIWCCRIFEESIANYHWNGQSRTRCESNTKTADTAERQSGLLIVDNRGLKCLPHKPCWKYDQRWNNVSDILSVLSLRRLGGDFPYVCMEYI